MMNEEKNVRSWASDLEDQARKQAERTARLPILAGPLAMMPDAHLGMGATIGSVILTENAIIPSAVGVDIGCGMIAVETTLSAEELPDSLTSFMLSVRAKIPAGVGKGHEDDLPEATVKWLASNPHELTERQLGS